MALQWAWQPVGGHFKFVTMATHVTCTCMQHTWTHLAQTFAQLPTSLDIRDSNINMTYCKMVAGEVPPRACTVVLYVVTFRTGPETLSDHHHSAASTGLCNEHCCPAAVHVFTKLDFTFHQCRMTTTRCLRLARNPMMTEIIIGVTVVMVLEPLQ